MGIMESALKLTPEEELAALVRRKEAILMFNDVVPADRPILQGIEERIKELEKQLPLK